ncbi:MAG: hypothetical protein K9N55_18355 [Phycisphaerae bacterium]|nr:hypothetical protein [Phycisphaerae bacterium]
MTGKQRACFLVLALSLVYVPLASSEVMETEHMRFDFTDQGVTGVASPEDPYQAKVTSPQRPLALTVRYQVGQGTWQDLDLKGQRVTAVPDQGRVTYSVSGDTLSVTQTFQLHGKVLDWDIDLQATSEAPVRIGDLAISIPVVGPRGENPEQIFEHGFLAHPFISGHGSFVYYVRASGAPPYLMVTVKPGTQLEYTGTDRQGGFFVHSGQSGNRETRGTWRQSHTCLDLDAQGTDQSRARYGFRFQYAHSYDELRDILYREGLFDVRAVPGMTIPDNLSARFSLHTRARVQSIEAEFPAQTTIRPVNSTRSDTQIYEVTFKRLGENKLTIVHDGGRNTFLEYFVTEPLETLIKKRASFIATRQQIRDPNVWWDGVYGPYDMRHQVVRTIDDPDIFTGRMIYVLTCDDPGLCKAPFIASKNVSFPNQKEIESLEYYLEHFVWGRMQRTDSESPYPYGVYGTPHWYIDRDPEKRKAYTNRDLDKEHVWRSYDYPHVVMLYFHMYEIAKKYPSMSRYLDAPGYLERAWQTARAFFTYPYEIYPSYYETYKWGLYNELIVLKLAEALDREGLGEQAAWLRSEWEKKVKYFVYDDTYPFRSEYAFDRTAFESTYAFAKYGATHDMQPDQNLWWDIKQEKWYSHAQVRREDSRAFMDRQLAAGLCVRGWLETNFNQLGADRGVSYMAAMGGWGILDYGINFADNPFDWLQLGYASYLSSWCLMNTGRADTNYGYWFPGQANDGAAGWQFMSQKYGRAWMGTEVARGPWHYDGEIDLGFGGALRSAATVITQDPIFGWMAYGGAMKEDGDILSVTPRDGLRQRLVVVLPDQRIPWPAAVRFKLELDRDGFEPESDIVMDKHLNKITFLLENRTGEAHTTSLRLSIHPAAAYEVLQDGQKIPLTETGLWDYPWQADLTMAEQPCKIEITLDDQ